jgi:hypothetical protein
MSPFGMLWSRPPQNCSIAAAESFYKSLIPFLVRSTLFLGFLSKKACHIIQTTLNGINTQQTKTSIRIASIASDGETRRGSALVSLTFKNILSPSSKIYNHLANLVFMDLHVGDDDITPDKDWKHLFKRARNLLLRTRGIVISDVRITPTILKTHFQAEGVGADHIRSILNPNDKQDI